MEPFDTKIRSVIQKFSYPMWFVIQNPDVDCTCINHTTKQPKASCKKCLGTGHQVTIRKVRAAHQPAALGYRGQGLGTAERDCVGNYYTLQDVNAQPGDIIVDGGDIDVIQMPYAEHSDSTEVVYYKYETAPKKNDRRVFAKNFDEAIRGHTL